MSKHIATGIDVGTHFVRVVIGERQTKGRISKKRILATGFAPSRGLRHGYVLNANDAAKSVRDAVEQAEKASGIRVRSAYISIGGVSLEGFLATGSVVISRADNQVTDLDVENALKTAEDSLSKSVIQNRKVIHAAPIMFKIDGKEVLGRPTGMKGVKFEAKTLLITSMSQHLDDLIHVVEDAGVEVEDIVASPLAAGLVNLTKTQKIAGAVLLNIGAETTAMVVYENNMPISLNVFPIGSADITKDIALGLKIPLEEAEEVKIAGERQSSYPQKQLDEIITARLTDIFELVEAQLKKIKKNGLLPAGVVVTGGGSGITTIEDFAKAALKLPSQKVELSIANPKGVIRDASWSVAYGLSMLGLATPDEEPQGFTMARQTKDTLTGWVKKFLP